MNFLAHALLAGDDPGLIAGGVAGDWVKGPIDAVLLDVGFRRGVALHRAIDAYAETHPAFRQSRARVSAARRRWSGVFVDLFYDHLLARDWPQWNVLSLADYTRTVYAALDAIVPAQGALDAEAKRALALMRDEDWLSQYATLDGLDDILARMGRRVRRENPLSEGRAELLADLPGFERDFRSFLADAIRFAADWRNGIRTPAAVPPGTQEI
jgi:acyl carrier protein phosphodiesterase